MTLAAAIGEWAQLIASVATLVTAVVGPLLVLRSVRAVHTEVKTANGQTLAALADATEGRRIELDIPHGDRTSSEQHYVERLGDQ